MQKLVLFKFFLNLLLFFLPFLTPPPPKKKEKRIACNFSDWCIISLTLPMTMLRLFQALLKTYFLALCFGLLASSLVPQCLQKCGECTETVNNYDTRSCLSYCLGGKTDHQCNLFSVSAAKRGFGKRSLVCKKFCFQCKLTYPQYNGNKCLEECEMSKGLKLDVNCVDYWWQSRTSQTILVTYISHALGLFACLIS